MLLAFCDNKYGLSCRHLGTVFRWAALGLHWLVASYDCARRAIYKMLSGCERMVTTLLRVTRTHSVPNVAHHLSLLPRVHYVFALVAISGMSTAVTTTVIAVWMDATGLKVLMTIATVVMPTAAPAMCARPACTNSVVTPTATR
mmetsp:Transcript_52494/g.128810  ORF Transcript_52494/g.128810 Transcript_52494/m.128810 type:complete len:144 (+) Transcript_52494:885-1316(+)